MGEQEYQVTRLACAAGQKAPALKRGGTTTVPILDPSPVQMWARTDYFPIPGLHNILPQSAGLPQTYINAFGDNTDSGTLTNPMITGTIRMASITDGTSNTMMTAECNGRPAGYNGFYQIYFYVPDNRLVLLL